MPHSALTLRLPGRQPSNTSAKGGRAKMFIPDSLDDDEHAKLALDTKKTPRAEPHSASVFFLLFPAPAVLERAIRRVSDNFPTSQSSQNISKTQRFSHAAKTRKSSVSWIVRYFLKLHKITSFQIKNTIFTSFKKGQNISRMHTFHKAATTTKTCAGIHEFLGRSGSLPRPLRHAAAGLGHP